MIHRFQTARVLKKFPLVEEQTAAMDQITEASHVLAELAEKLNVSIEKIQALSL